VGHQAASLLVVISGEREGNLLTSDHDPQPQDPENGVIRIRAFRADLADAGSAHLRAGSGLLLRD